MILEQADAELVEDAIERQLRGSLNETLETYEEQYYDKDSDTSESMGFGNLDAGYLGQVDDLTGWTRGHDPTVLGRPYDEYPSVSILSHTIRPAPTDGQDDYNDIFVVETYVEVVTMADNPWLVNLRSKRIRQAVLEIMKKNKDLGGLAAGEASGPTAVMTNADSRPAYPDTGEGEGFWQQAVRMDYSHRIIVKTID
jgi:hypothetical protein